MSTIAVSGKGGTGKTTLTSLIIRWLSTQGKKSILAVDADANVSLNDLLGVELKDTLGSIREEMKNSANDLPAGMTKQQFLEYKIQTSLVETPAFDLIAMGRPEGPGCYCYANNLLRDILYTLSSNYAFTIIDNEAGMEHLSRRTAADIDSLLMVSEPTVRGVRTAGKISRLLKELETRVKNKYLVLNRVRSSIPQPVIEAIEEEGLNIFSTIPEDPALLELNSEGKDVWKLPADSPAFLEVGRFMNNLI